MFVLQYTVSGDKMNSEGESKSERVFEMTLKQIMVRAHEIAGNCEGNYRICLAIGLRQAWLEARLLKVGSEWRKANMHRIYVNNLARWYGLELDHYKTGNIAAASLDGQHISNGQSRKIEGRLCMAKVWYDVTTARFMGQSISTDDLECIVENIKTARVA